MVVPGLIHNGSLDGPGRLVRCHHVPSTGRFRGLQSAIACLKTGELAGSRRGHRVCRRHPMFATKSENPISPLYLDTITKYGKKSYNTTLCTVQHAQPHNHHACDNPASHEHHKHHDHHPPNSSLSSHHTSKLDKYESRTNSRLLPDFAVLSPQEWPRPSWIKA